MLLDSNIVIYATKPEFSFLRALIRREDSYVSAISYVEVLGYHRLAQSEKAQCESFFASMPWLSVDEPVVKHAALLRQTKKMKLGDAIVAATALVHNLKLATRNISDFSWIPDLKLFNPFDQQPAT